MAIGRAKPELGEPCNFCGVCCAMGPCPLSVRLLKTPEHQRCPALERDDDEVGFVCGLVRNPGKYVPLLSYEAADLSAEFAQYLQIGTFCDASHTAGLILTE